MSAPTDPTEARRTYGGVLRDVTVFVALLTVLGVAVGALVGGAAGVWGALVGAGIAAVFSLSTAYIMWATAAKPMHVMNAWLVGAWLGKMALLLVALVLLRGADFYHPGVLFVVLTLAILGSLAVEYRALASARVPHVDPESRDTLG